MKHLSALLLACILAIPAFAQVGENMIENFENVNKIRYAFVTGTLDSGFANPSMTGANMSPKVGRYTRNATVQYDVVVCNFKNGVIEDIGSYASNTKKFSMKVWTDAPVGTQVQLTIQNAAQSLSPYPTGRHSVYLATTTVQNAWENLVFNFDSYPSSGVDVNSLDQLIISFNNNSFTANVYLFDELAGPNIRSATVVPNSEYLWTDANSTNRLRYRGSDGVPSKAANPAPSASHIADSALKYVRSGVQYDVLRYGWDGQLQNLSQYRSNSRKFSLNVYSPAPNTTIQFTLQDSVRSLQAYPNGRFGEFVGVTTGTNAWERVTLSWTNTPDASVTDAQVNELAILFNSGSFNPITVYVDSIFGPSFGTVSVKPQVVKKPILYPNPAALNGHIALLLPEGNTALVDLMDSQGRIVKSESASRAQSSLPLSGLPAGVYTCRVTSGPKIWIQKLVIQN